MKKPKLRVLFAGTPEFGAYVLEKIYDAGWDVCGVMTAPDKPIGRNQSRLSVSAVKKTAMRLGLPILQPLRLKKDEVVEEVKALQPDVMVVVAFRMLPEVIWRISPYGTFNLHASLLPQYRGAAPIHWAIINGENKSGVTTFMIDTKIDTGHILLQNELLISPTETTGELHDRMMTTGAELVCDTLTGLAQQTLHTKPQVWRDEYKLAPKLTTEICKIDFSASAQTVYNHIRGLSPHPTAWCMLQCDQKQIRIKIYEASLHLTHPVGGNIAYPKISLSKKGISITLQDGVIEIEVAQIEGKPRMNAVALRNGLVNYKKIEIV